MKRSLSFLFALIVSVSAVVPSMNAAGTARENKRLHAGKITKNEAQHIVLKKFPGAQIRKCELNTGRAHGIWVLEVIKAGANTPSKVQVDGRSGKILP